MNANDTNKKEYVTIIHFTSLKGWMVIFKVEGASSNLPVKGRTNKTVRLVKMTQIVKCFPKIDR